MTDSRKTGSMLIVDERNRQINQEGWSYQHDQMWDRSELAKAAICYIIASLYEESVGSHFIIERMKYWWPERWDFKWWKPKDRIRNLVRAGALIAAEIDRVRIQDANKKEIPS